jgi:hypothetical protein
MLNTFLYPQEELIDTKQFMLGCINVGSSEQVTHSIQAQGAVWEYSSGIGVISSNQLVYNNSLVTTGNANFSNPGSWPGFNFIWLDLGYQMPRWGLGLYKVTNTKQTDKYFYLDSRDYAYATNTGGYTNPDFFIFFNDLFSQYYYNLNTPQPAIVNGSILRIWQIFNKTPNTSNLQNYWNNVLALVNQENHPRIIWGPYQASGITVQKYRIYRKYGGSPWVLFYSTSDADVLEFTDENLSIAQPGGQAGVTVEYKVCAVYNNTVETGFSNVVSVYVKGQEIEKSGHQENLYSINSYSLEQNYPNPFNPGTTINFSIKEEGLVILKVYDVLGKEIKTLVNENKPEGIYKVFFDASQLPSGMYFYSIKANKYSETKKMLLAK